MNKFYNLKLKRTSNRMFIVTLLSALPLLVHSAVFAQDTDRLLPLEKVSESVKEWNLLKADIKQLVVKNNTKNTGDVQSVVSDTKLTSKSDNKIQVLNNEHLSLLDMSNSIKEWDLLKSDVKALILTENKDINNNRLTLKLDANKINSLSNKQLSLLEMSNSMKEWNLLKSDVKTLILAEKTVEETIKVEPKAEEKAEMNKLQPDKETIEIKSTTVEQWGVQIGAYVSSKHLDAAINYFDEKSGSLNSTTLIYREFQSKENGGDDLYRLKVGPFSTRALANSHCNKLIKTNVNCFPVKLINTNMIAKQ